MIKKWQLFKSFGLLTYENNVIFVEKFGQLWIFRGMAPTGPDCVHLSSTGDVDDKLDVGIIIVVGPTRNGHILVRHFDIFSIGLEILRSDHDHEPDGSFIFEHLIRPATYRTHALDSSDSIVGDEDL